MRKLFYHFCRQNLFLLYLIGQTAFSPIFFIVVFSGFYIYSSVPFIYNFCFFLLMYNLIENTCIRLYLKNENRLIKAKNFIGSSFLHQHVTHSGIAKKGLVVGGTTAVVATPYVGTIVREKINTWERDRQADILSDKSKKAENEGKYDEAGLWKKAEIDVRGRAPGPIFVPPASPSLSED